MKGRKMMVGLTYISPQYIQEAEFDAISGTEAAKTGRLRIWLIAAIVATMLLLTGATVYTRWSSTAQTRYHPTEEIKQQAEKSGLSMMVPETKKAENPEEVLSVTDQGITIRLVQTIVDKYRAELTFRIEGFQLPEGRDPMVWPEVYLDGERRDWYSSLSGSFFDGTTRDENGKWIYTDGTPVQSDENGNVILHYTGSDGSLEYTEYISFLETDGRYFGKEIEVSFPYLAVSSLQKFGPDEVLVEGSWTLKWTLIGTAESISVSPNAEIGDSGVILLDAEIGQKTIRTRYKVPALWEGWNQLVELPQSVCGVRMKDGTQYICASSSFGFEDQNNMIYFIESDMYDGILDPGQVESLMFPKSWQKNERGIPRIAEYCYIPVEP